MTSWYSRAIGSPKTIKETFWAFFMTTLEKFTIYEA